MLLHIRPRFFGNYRDVDLIGLAIEPRGLLLTQHELVTRKPYPNKWISVACARSQRRAVDGILIETVEHMDEFRTMARWAIDAQIAVSHQVDYRIIDREFDAASDNSILWSETFGELGNWRNRDPNPFSRRGSPTMELERGMRRGSEIVDEFDAATGLVIRRKEAFEMPTIERGRILEGRMFDRLPRIENAFII